MKESSKARVCGMLVSLTPSPAQMSMIAQNQKEHRANSATAAFWPVSVHSGRIIAKAIRFCLSLSSKEKSLVGYLQQVYLSPFSVSVPGNTNFAGAPAMKYNPDDIQTCINIAIRL